MGNAAPKPHHTPDESTMVFDTHLCTPQGAHRVYGIHQHPAVCTINEYADIFGLATEALNFPSLCCCVGHVPQQAALLQRLHAQYPHLGIALRQVHHGGRLILVLVLTRPQPQQQQQPVAATVVLPGNHQDQEVASSMMSPMRLSQPLPPPIPPPPIPIVQAIPIRDRK